VLACIVLLAVVPACADVSALSFRTDKRLHWREPDDRELIELPVRISWRMTDYEADGGRFAVFVDRAPIRPNQTLRAVAGDDDSCKRDPACPDAEYLAQRRVYTTETTEVTLDQIAPLVGREKTQLHQLTVVLLDASGRRLGESAWTRRFRLERARY
jgi:hypothetical protein